MPSTVLGLLIFVAALGPGFVFVRQVERRDPRRPHSSLSEAVEMAVIGSAATAVACILVLGTGDAAGAISANVLARDGLGVFSADPWRWLGVVGLVLAISYGGALVVATVMLERAGTDVQHHAGGSGWNQAFNAQRPRGSDTFVTVHMRDGTRINGRVSTWSAQLEESRELLLHGPLAFRGPGGAASPRKSNQQFLLLREADVLYIEGHHHPLAPEGEAS